MSLLNICLFYGSNVVVVCRGLCSCWIRIHCWVRNRKLKKTDIICNSLSHATQLNMWKPTTSLEALVVKSDIQLGRVHLSLLHARSNLRIYSCRRQEVPFILQIRVASKLDYLFSQRCCSVLLSSTNGLNFFLFSWNLYTYIADHALTVKQWWFHMIRLISGCKCLLYLPCNCCCCHNLLISKKENTSTCTCPSSLSKNSSKNSTEEETFIKVPSKSFSDQQSEDFYVICTWFYKRHGEVEELPPHQEPLPRDLSQLALPRFDHQIHNMRKLITTVISFLILFICSALYLAFSYEQNL